jgi:hypothetical protein
MSDEATAFTNAKRIMVALDAPKPFEEIADIVVEGAPFICQAAALDGVDTIKAWADWMVNFGTNIAPGCSATVHSVAWDADNKTAHYFATFHAKHTGDGGPLPATNQETNTHYNYVLVMNDDDKCVSMTKVWNDGYCLKEMGWA